MRQGKPSTSTKTIIGKLDLGTKLHCHVAWQLHMNSLNHLRVLSHMQKWALANVESQSPLCEAAAGKNVAY
jgi:hypothetical protein